METNNNRQQNFIIFKETVTVKVGKKNGKSNSEFFNSEITDVCSAHFWESLIVSVTPKPVEIFKKNMESKYLGVILVPLNISLVKS